MKKFWAVFAAIWFLWATPVLAINCGIFAYKTGVPAAKYFPGDQANFDAAKVYVGTNGWIQIGPGCTGTITIGTLRDSVSVMQFDGDNIKWYGKKQTWFDRTGTQQFKVDSLGLSVSGEITNGIIARLGPVSTPTTGGAIRIVDGVTFPTWESAVADLPASRAGVLYPDSSRLWLRHPYHTFYLGSAYPAFNGDVSEVLGVERRFGLLGATNDQALKMGDFKSVFSDSSAFSNLSLNGVHFINQYGTGGLGGAGFDTGIALAGYSEGWGSSAISGSMYGAELASTMYKYGSAVNLFGSLNTAQIYAGSVSTVTNLRGMQALARVFAGGTGTVTLAVAAEGVASMEGAGSITDGIGGRFSVTKPGSGSITNATAAYITSPTVGGNNNYGLRIVGAASGGSNINRSLSVDAGQVFFGDSIRVNKGLYVGGQFIPKILRASATLDFDLTAVTCQDATITVTGAVVGDDVSIGIPNAAITTDVTYFGWVSAANTVAIRACDGALAGNPASGTFSVTVIQR